MTKAGRVKNVIVGLIMILTGILIGAFGEEAYWIIITVLGASLVVYGIRLIVFFAKMARHMVGGRSILYRAVITLDIGLFTLSLTDVPSIILVMYLAGVHGFSGIIDIAATQDKFSTGSASRVNPRFITRIIGNIAAAQIAISKGLKGPSLTVSTACSSGIDAITTGIHAPLKSFTSRVSVLL